MAELTNNTCAKHREALVNAANKVAVDNSVPCRICGWPTTYRDGYGPLCERYCEGPSVICEDQEAEE